MRRKIAAILAADVVGYSRLVAEDEHRALEHLLACREIFAEFVGRGGGRIFNTAGDAVLAEFPSAVEALLAGIDIQDCLHTHYMGQPDGFRMQFRMGMTIGDVVEREGDLLGDGVNLAARLEGLAEPGGICISGFMYEQVLNKVSVDFKDIGLQKVKNIPSPIHVYALSRSTLPQKAAKTTNSYARRLWWSLAFAGAVLCVVLVPMLITFYNLGLSRRLFDQSKTGSTITTGKLGVTLESPGIYGVVGALDRSKALSTVPHTFDPTQTPFVSDSERLAISQILSKHGPNSALALSVSGAYGVVSDRSALDTARDDALKLCSASNRGECMIYEANGVISWPRAIPLPPYPWIDPAVARTPFDVTRLRGLSEAERNHVSSSYLGSFDVKAIAMGPAGSWWYRSRRADEEEAARVALEQCGDREGTACRIVAVNDQFVVDDTTGPVDVMSDAVDRCDRLAGAPFDVGLSNEGVSLASIDTTIALPVCRNALTAHPEDLSLRLSLGRAIDKSGFLPEKALELYRSAADGGNVAAMNILGMAYDAGKLGLPRDAIMAGTLYRRSAEGGDPNGMRNLAMMLSAGKGMSQDKAEAARLFLLADRVQDKWKPRPRRQ